jgi:hypothetical protein
VEWTKLVSDEIYVAIQVRVEFGNKLSPLHLDLGGNLYIICNKFSTLHHDLGVNLYLICNKLSDDV